MQRAILMEAVMIAYLLWVVWYSRNRVRHSQLAVQRPGVRSVHDATDGELQAGIGACARWGVILALTATIIWLLVLALLVLMLLASGKSLAASPLAVAALLLDVAVVIGAPAAIWTLASGDARVMRRELESRRPTSSQPSA